MNNMLKNYVFVNKEDCIMTYFVKLSVTVNVSTHIFSDGLIFNSLTTANG